MSDKADISVITRNHKNTLPELQPEKENPTKQLLIIIQKPTTQTTTYNIKTLKIKKNKRHVHFCSASRRPILLGMPDINNLGVLIINYETIGRQVASDDNADNRKRNCQYDRAVQTEDRMPGSCTNKS